MSDISAVIFEERKYPQGTGNTSAIGDVVRFVPQVLFPNEPYAFVFFPEGTPNKPRPYFSDDVKIVESFRERHKNGNEVATFTLEAQLLVDAIDHRGDAIEQVKDIVWRAYNPVKTPSYRVADD